MTNLLVGYDGSPLAELALRRAMVLASHTNFALVHVVLVVDECGDDCVLPGGQVLSRFAALAFLRLTLQQRAAQWDLALPHVRLVAHVRVGKPAPTLIDTAYRFTIDLLILGGGGVREGRLGSVTREVLDSTHDLNIHLETLTSLTSRVEPWAQAAWALVPAARAPGTDAFTHAPRGHSDLPS